MKKYGFVIGTLAILAAGLVICKKVFGKKTETVDDEQNAAKKAWHWFNKENKRKEDETVDVVVKGFTA